jgi:hypothetical protein
VCRRRKGPILDYWRRKVGGRIGCWWEKVVGGSRRVVSFLLWRAHMCDRVREEREREMWWSSCGVVLVLQSNCGGPLSSAPPLPGCSVRAWVAGCYSWSCKNPKLSMLCVVVPCFSPPKLCSCSCKHPKVWCCVLWSPDSLLQNYSVKCFIL